MPPAKTAAAAMPKGKAKAKKSSGAGKFLFALMMVLVTIWSTACVLIPGMLPTIVALLTDRDREKALALTMGATNFAGCLPFIIDLWMMGQNFDNAMKILHNPQTWFIMYTAAGIGYVIYLVIPTLVAGIMAGNAGGKISRLQNNLEEMKRIWGPDVATDRKVSDYGEAS
jgi:hypothetical protein